MQMRTQAEVDKDGSIVLTVEFAEGVMGMMLVDRPVVNLNGDSGDGGEDSSDDGGGSGDSGRDSCTDDGKRGEVSGGCGERSGGSGRGEEGGEREEDVKNASGQGALNKEVEVMNAGVDILSNAPEIGENDGRAGKAGEAGEAVTVRKEDVGGSSEEEAATCKKAAATAATATAAAATALTAATDVATATTSAAVLASPASPSPPLSSPFSPRLGAADVTDTATHAGANGGFPQFSPFSPRLNTAHAADAGDAEGSGDDGGSDTDGTDGSDGDSDNSVKVFLGAFLETSVNGIIKDTMDTEDTEVCVDMVVEQAVDLGVRVGDVLVAVEGKWNETR
jgi:hypothetical protein